MYKDHRFNYYGNNKFIVSIIDDDFTEDVKVFSFPVDDCVLIPKAIIIGYSKRNLNVPLNLATLFYKVVSNYSSQEACLGRLPEYKQYHEEVLKAQQRYANIKSFW